jgi:hypothetical protein
MQTQVLEGPRRMTGAAFHPFKVPRDTMVQRLRPGGFTPQNRYPVHFTIDFRCEKKSAIPLRRVRQQMSSGGFDNPPAGFEIVVALRLCGPQSTNIGGRNLSRPWQFSGKTMAIRASHFNLVL